jgi:hypothetical protein
MLSREHTREAYLVERLTWEGHKFLDAARSDTAWERAKKLVLAKGGALTFDAVKTALGALTREAVILAAHTGSFQ